MELNGVRVSRETHERLNIFSKLFMKWAKTINLVAPSTVSDLWSRHIADSAQIFQLYPKAARWIDLGSGGGFPGIITGIFLAELGDGLVELIESNKKKAAFLRTAIAETGARARVHPVRIEEAAVSVGPCDAVSARALAELDLLLEYSENWLFGDGNSEKRAFFHKGRDYQQEIAKANGSWVFDLIEHRSAVEQDSVILEISNVRRKNQSI